MSLNAISNNHLPQIDFFQSYQSKPTSPRFTVLKEANFKFRDLFSWIPFLKQKNSRYKSIIDRLEKSQKHTVSEQEMEKFLNDVENGTFEKVATDKEILRATHLLINYARTGTQDPTEKESIEQDVQQLFALDNLKFSPNLLKGEHLCCSLEHCYKKNGKKSNIFQKFGKFVKKHRKAIIITAVIVVAVAIAVGVGIAVAKGAGAAAAAQGATAATGALAGAIGTSQPKKEEETQESEPNNEKVIEGPPPKIEPEVKVINPEESESTSKIGSIIKETLTQNKPHSTENTSTLHKTLVDPIAKVQPQNKGNAFPKNFPCKPVDNLEKPKLNQIADQQSRYANGPQLNTIATQPIYSVYQVTGVTPTQFDDIASKIIHDAYDEWANLKAELVKEQELTRNLISKIAPNSNLGSLNLITSEDQQLIANKGHEKIDDFFLTNQAGNYLPSINTSDNYVYGICPPPQGEGFFGKKGWELKNFPVNSVRNTTTQINNINYRAHALDQMQNRGIVPSMIENAINNGEVMLGNKNTTNYYDPVNKIKVVLNKNKEVVTVYFTDKI